ncbi:MAG: flagellar hook-basal body complex protein [Phycisphaerales bacterium]|nr:MAG: flagellar hook-basal body complex protein [Phycisphaerales bacterium]
MASMTSMFTGLSGLSANSRRLDVIGNNIANVNTTAFKSNRMIFQPTFSRNFSLGTSPNEFSGGTNPGQVGLGTTVAGTQRSFSNGAISATGVLTDIAIEGDGFFIVRNGNEQFYTRAGSFQRNEANDLVTITGSKVQGFTVDDQFQVVDGELVDLNIPLGTLTLAEASRSVVFNGNLNASGPLPTSGSIHNARAMFTTDTLTPGTEMDGTEDLTDPANSLWIDNGAGGVFQAIEGGENTIITISGIEKGGKDLGKFTFGFMDAATAADRGVDGFGTNMNDYIEFLEDVLGLTSTDVNGFNLGGGIEINADGQIVITGNEGKVQDLNMQTASFVASSDSGNAISQPFVMSKSGEADGESVRTSFIVYDSLGTPLTVDLTFVLKDAEDGAGTTWKYIAESKDNDALNRIVGMGIVNFDANGKYVEASNDSFSIIRQNGAVSPLTVTMDFDSGTDAISALTDKGSNLAAVYQDGSPIGTLSNFSIGNDGVISGAFTNGLTRTIGQIALANFSNPEGLVDAGNNLFTAGPNSGTPLVTKPTEFGTGRVVGGALELSNVDLSQEFINMILASTGYSASSRVITTTNELIQQLLVLGR